jgi:hypothetical protein
MNYEDPSIISSTYTVGTANASFCSGVIRMNYSEYVMSNGKLTASSGIYPPVSISTPAWVSGWSSAGGTTGSSSLVTTATAKRGEPYLFTYYMSNNTVIKYINRLPSSTLTTTQAAMLSYPTFTSDMSAKFASYDGSQASTLAVTWNSMDSALIFADALFWNRGEVNSTSRMGPGVTSNSVSCPSVSYLVSITNSDGDAVSALNCRDQKNWKSSTSSTPNQGVLQLKARTFDGLFIQSQLRQY